jgi:hypothetical protein
MRYKGLIAVLVAILLVSGLSYAGWRFVHEKEEHTCAACLRPVHLHTKATGMVNGRTKGYCCPACALSDRLQTGADLKITSLTDFATGARLSPEEAFVVRGSDQNSCHHTGAASAGMDKRAMETHYDRCTPSLLTFATRDKAVAFSKEHGGQVRSFASVAQYFR